jgi:hypothetical protein
MRTVESSGLLLSTDTIPETRPTSINTSMMSRDWPLLLRPNALSLQGSTLESTKTKKCSTREGCLFQLLTIKVTPYTLRNRGILIRRFIGVWFTILSSRSSETRRLGWKLGSRLCLVTLVWITDTLILGAIGLINFWMRGRREKCSLSSVSFIR